MKKLIPLIICLFVSAMTFAQGGVDFQHLTFDEALAKAKAEKKLVFVDCYTTWCGPCKHMTNEVFPQEKAGEFFNPRFVCVKFDMEKGEGIDLKKKLGVRAYPSFFIIRPDGTVQHSIVGSDELPEFIKRVEKGLNEKTSLLYLENQYKKGKMNNKQLMAYYQALSDAYDKVNTDKVLKELQSKLTNKEKLKPEFWPLFEDSQAGTPDFDFVLANLPAFEKSLGKAKLDEYLHKAYFSAISSALTGRMASKEKTVNIADLEKQISNLNIEKKADLLRYCQIVTAVNQENIAQLLSILEPRAANLTGDELWLVTTALQRTSKKATKEQLNQYVALGEKILSNPENEKLKPYLEMNFANYKRMAHVGVYFEDLTLEQAMTKAKQQGKYLFIDCYTSWCGPCKNMTANVFPQEKMGDFMNPKFICVKYDMEKGEGPEIAKKFGVRAYPTFVMLKPDGSLQHIMVGGGEADKFIERINEGLDDTKAFGGLDAKYKAGDRDKAFVAQYVKCLSKMYSAEAPKVAAELYRSLNDDEKVSNDYWFLFESNELAPDDSEAAKYLVANREKFNQSIGKEKVDKRLSKGFEQKLMMILYGRDTKTTAKELDQMKKDITALKLDNGKSLLAQVNIAKAVLADKQDQLIAVCEKELSQMPAEEFPYFMVVYKAKEKATPAQMDRWIKLGKKVVAKAQDPKFKEGMEQFVNGLAEKK